MVHYIIVAKTMEMRSLLAIVEEAALPLCPPQNNTICRAEKGPDYCAVTSMVYECVLDGQGPVMCAVT
jgi:hypothetical protein